MPSSQNPSHKRKKPQWGEFNFCMKRETDLSCQENENPKKASWHEVLNESSITEMTFCTSKDELNHLLGESRPFLKREKMNSRHFRCEMFKFMLDT